MTEVNSAIPIEAMNSGSRTTGNQSVSILGAKPKIGNRTSRIMDAISASKHGVAHRGQREHLTRAVELVQQRCLAGQAGRASADRRGEERPRNQPEIGEQHVRNSRRDPANVGDLREQHGEGDHLYDRVDHRPSETQRRLLVTHAQVALDQGDQQLTEGPDLAHGGADAYASLEYDLRPRFLRNVR